MSIVRLSPTYSKYYKFIISNLILLFLIFQISGTVYYCGLNCFLDVDIIGILLGIYVLFYLYRINDVSYDDEYLIVNNFFSKKSYLLSDVIIKKDIGYVLKKIIIKNETNCISVLYLEDMYDMVTNNDIKSKKDKCFELFIKQKNPNIKFLPRRFIIF